MASLRERLRSWRLPEARQRRKTARRRAWHEAQDEADARRHRDYPPLEGYYGANKQDPPKS